MKTVLAVVGILAVLLLLASGPARQQIGDWFSSGGNSQLSPIGYDEPGYGQEAPVAYPTAYQTAFAPPQHPGECHGEIGCNQPATPFGFFGGSGRQREVRTSFEYQESRQSPTYNRVWVQPQYRVVYQYGRPQRVLVRAGYYRQVSVGGGRDRHVAFDFGQILNSFRQ